VTNSADHSWTHAGHGLPGSEPSLNTTAIATALQLPAGFAAIAEDAELGPAITTNLARVEKKLREAIANSDPLADATSRHLVEAGGKRVRPLLTLLCAHLGHA
jgi:heptaprenyl diphosphate synthase